MNMKKVILAFISGLSLSVIGVAALSLCNAKDIEYNSKDTTWDVDTVSDALNDLYKSKGSNTNDSCNNVAKPNLGIEGKLIPITLSNAGKATVVSENDPNWYNYCEKRWANAVILNDDAQNYSVGSEIDDDDIESYFVWIPKYKYKLWNVNPNSKDSLAQVHIIDIIFDTTNTIDKEGESCQTPMNEDNTQGLSGNIKSCSNGEYMTHPAFISFGVNGFWVGKFTTGHRTATTTAQAQVSSNDSGLIVVKPDVFSWRSNPVKNMFEAAYNYDNSENRDLDSHMMKNTEWGAVAYLSHSKYGIGTQININNNSSYKTGYSALPETFQSTYTGSNGDDPAYNQLWNTVVGYLASSTGNITGIYDMSGGAWEVMAAYKTGSYGNSGFNANNHLVGTYKEKYYDSYNSSSNVNSYQYMILGDATGEMGPFRQLTIGSNNSISSSWYADSGYFFESSWTWFNRCAGPDHGANAGQFYFRGVDGAAYISRSFRLVLSPLN